MDILTSIETVMDSDLLHYGRKGMKWGVRNGPPYPLHPEQLSPAEKKARRSVFISGSSKTQDWESDYWLPVLPDAIRNKIDGYVKDKAKIIVGDAPGIDRQVQDYLNDIGYKDVEIYGPGKQVRYTANDKWKTNPIDAPEFEEMSPEWLRKKDIAMTNEATEGLAIVLDEGAKATRNNVERLREQGKAVDVYVLSKLGLPGWETEPGSYMSSGMKYHDERARVNEETQDIINDITKTWSSQDASFFNNDRHYVQDDHLINRSLVKAEKDESFRGFVDRMKRKFTGVNVDDVASFCDLVSYGDELNVEIGTKGGGKYRNKGYGYKAAKEAIDWVEANKNSDKLRDYDTLVWQAYADNYGSIKIADKLGFDTKTEYTNRWGEKEVRFEKALKHADTFFAESAMAQTRKEKWEAYNLKKSYKNSISHSDFLSAVELVLPDDALQYGVNGQKWGIRRWQNKDGTLTPAGRERWINSLKQEAYAASKKWEEYQAVRKQVINMHYEGKFDNELETKMLRLKDEAEEAGAIWGSLRKRIESYLENGPDVSTSEPVEDAPHKVLIPVSDEKKYQHFLDLGYVEKGRNDTWIYMVNDKKNIKHSDNQNDVLAAVEVVMDGDIEHHGRRGQKWGIRNGPPYPLDSDRLSARERMLDKEGKNIAATGSQKGWQKSKLLTEFAKVPYTGALDARLTKLGRKHMEKMLGGKELQKWGEANKQAREHSLKKAGIQKSEEGGHIMKVGSKLYRIADATDQVDDKRKYVSATENDKERYDETFIKGFLALHKRDTATEFQYKGNKDIRIADADDVLSYVVDKYGGKREKQLLADVRRAEQFMDVLKELNVTRLGTAADVAVANYLANTAPMELRSFVKSQLWDGSSAKGKKVYADNKQSEILGHYRDLGYDAIVDVEDYLSGYEYPMIMIDPKKSISTKQKRALDPDMEDPERRARLTEAGVKRQSSADDVIAKGTQFTRQATVDDDQYHDRKYMSVTKKDTDYYRKEFGDDAEYRYEAKKKLKVASAKAVVDYIVKDMDNYGDSEEGKQLSALYDKYRGKTDGWAWQIKANKERDRFEQEVVAKQRTKYGRENETEFNSQKQILDHFSQLGYDAIVDINQSWQGMDYPVIIIDPDNSTKLKTKITKRTFKDKVENY